MALKIRFGLTFFLIWAMCPYVLADSLRGIKKDLLEVVRKYDAQVGIAIILNGNDTLTVNNDEKYPLMSVFKFHQALAIGHYLQSHQIGYDFKIHIAREDLLRDTYSPLRDSFPDGNIDLSIAELLGYTLQLSDNNACDILFRQLVGVKQTDRFVRSLGIDDFSIRMNEEDMHVKIENCYENWTTPLSAVRLLELFVNKKIVSGEYYDYIFKTMTECTTGVSRLPLPLKDSQAVIGHKTGTSDRNSDGKWIGINDIGFVILPDGTSYSIAVFVKDSAEPFSVTERIIAEVSSVVYNHIRKETYIPLRKAYDGFVWKKMSGAGLTLWVQENDKIRLMADDSLPGIVMAREGDLIPHELIRIFDLPNRDINDVIVTLEKMENWDKRQMGRFKEVKSGREGVRRFVLIPAGDYAREVEIRMKSEPVPTSCNGWGIGNSGMRYFEVYDRRPDKAVFVEIGQDAPLFDENSIQFADPD